MKKLFIITILFTIIFEQSSSLAQQSKITFEHFGRAQGLPSTVVPCIYQDKTGFIWFGTFNGIARYDGYTIVPFANKVDDTTSITNAIVQAICDDSEGNIWIGHARGLDKYEPATGMFKHYIVNSKMSLTDWSNHVISVLEDKDKNLWIGTGGGVYLFDKAKETFLWIKHDSTNTSSIIHNAVNAIYEDRTGTLWFGTGNGLDKYDKVGKKFIHYLSDSKEHSNMFAWPPWILSIIEDRDGIFWLGTNWGVVEFNKMNGSFTRYTNDITNTNSLANNDVLSICEDHAGLFWISTKAGVDLFNKKTKSFIHYAFNQNDNNSLSSNDVGQILCDKSGSIWITTYAGGGVNKFTPSDPAIKKYFIKTEVTGPIESTSIVDMAEDLNGLIWIGTLTGLLQFNPKTELCKKESIDKEVVSLLVDKSGTIWVNLNSGDLFYKKNQDQKFNRFLDSTGNAFNESILTMKNGRNGEIWIGSSNGKIIKLNPKSGKLNLLLHLNNWIETIYQDSKGSLWIGTRDQGLISYDLLTKTYKKFSIDSKDISISSNEIDRIREDNSGNIWVLAGTTLNKYDKDTQKFIHVGKKYGFPEDIYNIIIDFRGNFWMSTTTGTVKYNPSTQKFINFSNITGFGYKLRNGELCYNQLTNFIQFHPDSINENKYIPPVVITSFKIFEKSHPFGKKIQLPYYENYISFEFAALSFNHPENNQYAYKLEGIDKDWIYSGTRRFASYPNLDPGEYTLRVKGSNNDGVWNEEGTSVAIIISPPWWKTWWAYSSYALIFIFSLYWIRRYEMNRLKLKDKIKLDEVVLKEKEETDKMKSRFFANISHEFRTPLTLILGPAEKIKSKTSDDIVKDANIIERNSRRLLQLINQLLDLSKLEAGKLKLEASKGNIASFVKGVALSFESLAESKDITLKLHSEKDLIELYFDKEKMMKILTNILSNAFKFTPEEGNITVSVRECHSELVSESQVGSEMLKQVQHDKMKKFVEIKIRDTGIGIAEEEIPKLFDRFYQVDSSYTKEYEGTGIGLALTKELVELHHGRISVESEKGVYSEFTLQFPLGREHLKDEEIIEEKEIRETAIQNHEKVVKKNLTEEIGVTFNKENSLPQNDIEKEDDKTIILVVEDNYDMRQYIRESLNGNYLIEEAVNGEQGVRKAEKIIPDLIISDMMMPKMDGNELVRILKNDEKTSHIPIILLTAKAGQEDKLEGLETGADDYLTKPFDIKELQVRIKNLINIRKKLQEKFSKIENQFPALKGLKISSLDEKFILKVNEVIEKHIPEEKFSIEEFAKEVGMSKSQFHRKFTAITGKPASMYLRSVRLSTAKKMIEGKTGNISEIAFSVGFSSLSYFSKCFKEEFGYPPSELI